ncbi:MAG: zinc-dependent alcohol dehydrogenase family protein [Aggregatilineales bacterium]
MRAVRYDQLGEPAQVLRVENVPRPEPGPQELLIRVTARPINPSDLLTIDGRYGVLPKLPTTPGNEAAGVIESLGSEVKGLRVGQRVVPLGANQGTWQEYVTARAASVLPIPDSINDHQASMLLVNPPTAWIMLTEMLNVQPGEWLLQTAAGSAVGAWVIKIAHKIGAKTINLVRRRDQIEALKAFGADEVICTSDEDVAERVKAITGGKGVPYALDAVGGDTGTQAFAALGRHGTLVVYGLLSGEPMKVDGRMIFRESTVRGFWRSLWLRNASAEKMSAVFSALLPMLAEQQVESPIETTYDLADVVQAVSHAARPGRNGKILLVG